MTIHDMQIVKSVGNFDLQTENPIIKIIGTVSYDKRMSAGIDRKWPRITPHITFLKHCNLNLFRFWLIFPEKWDSFSRLQHQRLLWIYLTYFNFVICCIWENVPRTHFNDFLEIFIRVSCIVWQVSISLKIT